MSLILSGTDGLSDVDGSASTPAIRGTDTNTGIFFPAADTIAFAEGGAEAMRINSSGYVGIGTSSPSTILHLSSTLPILTFTDTNDSATTRLYQDNAVFAIDVDFADTKASSSLEFRVDNTARMTIDNGGGVFIGCTSTPSSSVSGIRLSNPTAYGQSVFSTGSGTGVATVMAFVNGNGQVGRIDTSGSNAVYVTTSDYRLKENIAPMTGALAKVSLLKPCTYTWKADGSDGEGFIAHELQEVFPQAAVGEKDAVEEDGSIKPQGIDTSFLVATLTAAIQELKAELDSVKAELATLKA
jgi:hypothetical protein